MLYHRFTVMAGMFTEMEEDTLAADNLDIMSGTEYAIEQTEQDTLMYPMSNVPNV